MTNATIRDVAELANVGVGTVSRVLNNSPAVKAETRQRVLEAIAELDYTPHPIARSLSLGRTHTVGVVLPFLTRPSTVERLRGVHGVLADSNYDLVLYIVNTPEQRDEYFDGLIRSSRIDGLLTISLPPSDAQVERIVASGVPFVQVDGTHPDLYRVEMDDLEGGYLATRHLIELGHRNIAFISDTLDNPFGFTSMALRFEGYRNALSEAGITFRPEYHRFGDHGRDEASEMTAELLSMPEPPTAIFAASDTQAYGVLDAAAALEYRLPDDLSVIGYDDIEISAYVQLTTISQPLVESGSVGAAMLLEWLTGSDSGNWREPRPRRLPVALVPRRTTGPAP